MFSIGTLGFIVWSQKVALLYCKVKVTNLTICFNSTTLVNTFFFLTLTACVKTSLGSNNFNSITQLAGNRNLSSSSETTRKKSFNFEKFNNSLPACPP